MSCTSSKVTVWRLVAPQALETAFSGEGGLYVSGRWTSRGCPVVYTSSTLSLASLELFLPAESAKVPLLAISVAISSSEIEEIEVGSLPEGWQALQDSPQLQAHGDRWLRKRISPVLRVPSAIVPTESNYLLNPVLMTPKLEPYYVFDLSQGTWSLDAINQNKR